MITCSANNIEPTPHAYSRAKERFKLNLKDSDVSKLSLDINNGYYVGFKKDSRGKNNLILVRCGGKLVTVCVNFRTMRIVSFLPVELYRWHQLKKYLTPSVKRYNLRMLSRYVAGNIDELNLITQPLVNTEKVQENPHARPEASKDLTP